MAQTHLTDEELAALSSSPDAQAHVASCEACAARQEALSARLRLDAPTSEVGAPPSARAEAKLHTLPEGTKIGRYLVVGVVGEGGMGKVYRAFDPELDRKVALKLLHVSRSDAHPGEARARMLREAQALARLSHP